MGQDDGVAPLFEVEDFVAEIQGGGGGGHGKKMVKKYGNYGY
jgi:hypothetical protein